MTVTHPPEPIGYRALPVTKTTLPRLLGGGNWKFGAGGNGAKMKPAEVVVCGGSRGGSRRKGRPRRQQVGDRHAGGIVGPAVRHGDRVGDRSSFVGRCVVHRLGHRQVSALHRDGAVTYALNCGGGHSF